MKGARARESIDRGGHDCARPSNPHVLYDNWEGGEGGHTRRGLVTYLIMGRRSHYKDRQEEKKVRQTLSDASRRKKKRTIMGGGVGREVGEGKEKGGLRLYIADRHFHKKATAIVKGTGIKRRKVRVPYMRLGAPHYLRKIAIKIEALINTPGEKGEDGEETASKSGERFLHHKKKKGERKKREQRACGQSLKEDVRDISASRGAESRVS